MIFLNIEAISSTPFALLSSSWTILFPWSFNTAIHNLALIWTLYGISSSLPSCWTYIHFSFHSPQVYAINSIFYSTLRKLVRPLMVLSFNSPKPTKGLDALTRCTKQVLSNGWMTCQSILPCFTQRRDMSYNGMVHQPIFEKSSMFTSFLSLQNLFSSSGLVNISASWSSVPTLLMQMSPFCWWSLIK